MKKYLALFSLVCGLFVLMSGTVYGQGTVVIAGGGAEGDQGDQTAWSYQLYKKLIENGDKNGDGIIKVAILTSDPADPAAFIEGYFQWIGTTLGVTVQAKQYTVQTRTDAGSSAKVGEIANADVVFIKGGDQGVYYDEWNNTLLETHIRTVIGRGGAIGGTSAGAMSQAEYCFSGGYDMISADVLADARTTQLDDRYTPGTSGIHTDFLSFVPGCVIETHYTERGRLGRAVGILAKAIEDTNNHTIYAIALDSYTGVWIRNGVAEVVGEGEVSFIKESATSNLRRTAGKPLFYTNLVLDRLTHGWKYNLTTRTPVTTSVPAGVSTVTYAGDGSANSGVLSITGATETDKSKFQKQATYYPTNYGVTTTTATTYVRNAIGFTDAGNSTNRADKQETLYMALHDNPSYIGFLAFSGGTISRTSTAPDELSFGGTLATIVIDGKTVTYKGLSPYVSGYATTGGALRAAALINATLHILSDSTTQNTRLNSRTHALVTGTGGGGGGETGTSINEVEPNNSRTAPQDITSLAFPVTITGKIGSTTDRDYFRFTLGSGQSVTINLTVPSNKDYDLYLLSNSGFIEARSTRAGNGLAESITFTNTSSGTNTYFAQVEGYNRAYSTTANYTLRIAK